MISTVQIDLISPSHIHQLPPFTHSQYRYNILRKRNAAVASAAAAAASTQNSVTNNNDTFSSSSISARLPPDLAPPVSILRPLKGIDVNMFENLSSSFCQDYPNVREREEKKNLFNHYISKYRQPFKKKV